MIVTSYTSKPAQFRFPKWAHEFLAQESATTGMSKTEIVTEALSAYKAKHFEDLMVEGYRACGDVLREEVREWDSTLADGLEDEDW